MWMVHSCALWYNRYKTTGMTVGVRSYSSYERESVVYLKQCSSFLALLMTEPEDHGGNVLRLQRGHELWIKQNVLFIAHLLYNCPKTTTTTTMGCFRFSSSIWSLVCCLTVFAKCVNSENTTMCMVWVIRQTPRVCPLSTEITNCRLFVRVLTKRNYMGGA